MIEIFSFMHILSLLFSFLAFLIISSASLSAAEAVDNSSNFNSQEFVIHLGPMDPLWDSHSSGGADAWGIDAFMIVIGNLTDILLFILPALAGISLLIAGYFYIFSAGDSEKSQKAKTIIKWNIIALLVGFLSYAIVRIVASFFNT